jgi:hypothetical protein
MGRVEGGVEGKWKSPSTLQTLCSSAFQPFGGRNTDFRDHRFFRRGGEVDGGHLSTIIEYSVHLNCRHSRPLPACNNDAFRIT